MRKRLSRAESQARTRADLIASATGLFLANGYVATSNNQVAEAAGYSRGAVYSNFASKEELALAVLDRHTAEEFDAVRAALGSGSIEDRFDAFESWLVTAAGDPRWALLKSEMALAARTSPTLRAQLAAHDAAARDTVSGLITQLIDDSGLAVPIEPHTLARLVLALGKGVAIEGIIEPDQPMQWLRDLLATLRPWVRILVEFPPDTRA
ncbi:TetR/AcrR family transcriptional regulator [Nocardia altamirensis]|uniref:TetR/AcrR family transcriptional regulator n=1 Tax=Nocardia altamirensis TaxID=472158 RepID=UPI0008402414|nr:TetR/AcrR family transcriptional regulator [Nocardia altamirensis]